MGPGGWESLVSRSSIPELIEMSSTVSGGPDEGRSLRTDALGNPEDPLGGEGAIHVHFQSTRLKK